MCHGAIEASGGITLPIIRTENLRYVYSVGTPFEKAAVDDINIEIEKGELVGVIGHTGSGKSTLVQHFNGLLKPTSGKVYIDGQDIWAKGVDRRAIRFKVGLVFQYPEYQLFEETVFKDIAFGPKNMGLGTDEITERVNEAADFVGLDRELLVKSPFELSGGQMRRAAIAGVMAMRPEVLILDEPAAGLDPHGRDSILRRISEYHRARQSTVLLVSHSMEDIAQYATKVFVMNKAKAAMYGGVAEIFARSPELVAMGLDVPQVTRIFMELRSRGYDLSESIYTVPQGRDELLRYLREVCGR
jgi:energy-coupling factor transport system ATP-binding protein